MPDLDRPDLDQRVAASLLTTLGSVPIPGNAVTVLRNGVQIFPAMLEAIEAAEHTIDFMTFVYWQGDIAKRMANALAERARAGVQVRVLIDAFGGRLMRDELVERMRDAGCEVHWFRPIGGPLTPHRFRSPRKLLHRTHRKILVCDNRVGFTGGVGIAQEWEGDAQGPDEWRETHVRIEGPAAAALRSGFEVNWAEACDDIARVNEEPAPNEAGSVALQVVRGQPGLYTSDVALALQAMIGAAQRRLLITTAYFAPGPPMRELLRQRAADGVDVQVLLPGPHVDKRVSRVIARDALSRLIDEGVHVHEFQPTMLHAKVVVADDVAMIGSANFNGRSMDQDDESIVVIHDREIADELAQHFADDLERSEPMDPERFEQRPWRHRALEKAVSVLRRVA